MDNLSPTVCFFIFLTVVLLIILYRVFGHRHGQEIKRSMEDIYPTESIEEILGNIKEIVEEEKQKKTQKPRE